MYLQEDKILLFDYMKFTAVLLLYVQIIFGKLSVAAV